MENIKQDNAVAQDHAWAGWCGFWRKKNSFINGNNRSRAWKLEGVNHSRSDCRNFLTELVNTQLVYLLVLKS